VNDELEKYLEGSGRGLILKYYHGTRLEGLRTSTKTICDDSWRPGRNFNPGPFEYEAGVLTTRPRRSVTFRNIASCKYSAE
jgi:hypothetical protein